MTDHPEPKLVLMTYDFVDGVASLSSRSHQSLADRAARQAEFITDFKVDPSGQIVVACAYTGKLKIVTLKNGNLENAFDVSCVNICTPYKRELTL